MLKNIKLVWDIFLLSHRNDPKITLYELLHGLCLNVRRVVNVIMPAYIVNLICGEREGKVILAAAVSYGVLLCLLGCGEKSFKLLQEAHGFRACNLLRLSMNKKFMRLDYADTEKSEVIDSFEEAKDSMWEFTDVGYVLFDDIAGNLLSFVFMSYILTDINPLIYVFVLILVGINLYVQHRKNAFFHQVELEEKRAEKQMNYMARIIN